MNLAVMLATDHESTVGEAASLCRAAVGRGHRVNLFLLAAAATEVDLGSELAATGVRVSLCEADAAQRGLHKSGYPGVFFGSLYDWSVLVEDADRVLSLA
ncbi:MAG: hypothetical protein NVSMB17_01760 [Candidatus Dormibacteria bacterium]